MAGDKDTGALTLSGFTQVYNDNTANVSLYYYYKVSAGTETSVTATTAVASASGATCFYGEYTDSAVSGTDWQIAGQAHNIATATTATSWATGTTGTLTNAGLGIAAAVIDSRSNVTSGEAWTNSYTHRFSSAGGANAGGSFVGEKSESAGVTTTTTFSFTGSADNLGAAIVVFYKAAA